MVPTLPSRIASFWLFLTPGLRILSPLQGSPGTGRLPGRTALSMPSNRVSCYLLLSSRELYDSLMTRTGPSDMKTLEEEVSCPFMLRACIHADTCLNYASNVGHSAKLPGRQLWKYMGPPTGLVPATTGSLVRDG
jgi:hypothetical protein